MQNKENQNNEYEIYHQIPKFDFFSWAWTLLI